MSVRQYVGARYVPIFGRKGENTILWDSTKPYEPLTVVLYQGASFTSRQYVPAGIDIHNYEFWALTGNYNAQVEQYRQEVHTFDSRLESVEGSVEDINGSLETIGGDITSLNGSVNTINDKLGSGFDATNTVAAAISAEQTARANGDNAIDAKLGSGFSSTNTVAAAITAEQTARFNADSAIEAKLGSGFSSTDTVAKAIQDETTARTNADNALSARIDALQPTTLNHIVFFGDSYGTGYQPAGSALANNIPVVVTEYLDENLTLHNYCANATGFITTSGGVNFNSELNQAISDSTVGEWANLVKYVVVIGGRNDSNSTANAQTNSASFFAGVRSQFPNAKVFYLYLWDAYRRPNATQIQNYRTYNRQACLHNVITDAMSPSWGLLRTQWYATSGSHNGDDIHPNQDGVNYFAQCIVELMNGGNGNHSDTYIGDFGNGVTVRTSGFMAIIEGNAMQGSGNADVHLATLPACLSFSNLQMVLGQSGDAIFWCRCDANQDGYTADFKAVGGKTFSGGSPSNVTNGFVSTTVHMWSA